MYLENHKCISFIKKLQLTKKNILELKWTLILEVYIRIIFGWISIF
jgi:hypothetical protein